MWERQPIGELDLLAYADDPCGLEPQRRQAVEAHLSRHAADAARVEMFRRQNLALRERYDGICQAPVPPRLYDILERGDRPSRPVMRLAAAAAVIAATAAAGWLAGGGHGGPALFALTQQPPAADRPVAGGEPARAEPSAPQAASVAGLLEYGAAQPDLAHLGFSLVASEPVSGRSSGAVRLTYAGEAGRSFNLLLRSRWHDRFPGFQVKKEGEVSIVSWEEGRLAAELTSRVGREEALEIAEAVRKALRSLDPADPTPAGGMLAVGSAEPVDSVEAGAPLLPQQLQ